MLLCESAAIAEPTSSNLALLPHPLTSSDVVPINKIIAATVDGLRRRLYNTNNIKSPDKINARNRSSLKNADQASAICLR